MKTIILCGGKGTRMHGFGNIPKTMVTIGGIPVLWHIMNYYASYGYTGFHLCLGYGGSYICDYAKDNTPDGWDIKTWDTGLETTTLGRIKFIEQLDTTEQFFLTYSDGIADVNLLDLLQFHKAHGKLMTMVGIQQRSKFGIAHCIDNTVVEFKEKPPIHKHHCINGGFFVCNRGIFDLIPHNTSESLEEYLLPLLASKGQLKVYNHNGFWQCMDDNRDWFVLMESHRHGGRQWVD